MLTPAQAPQRPNHLDAIDSVKEAIKWAVAAAKEHVDLCRHTGESPDPDISMGIWQSFQAEFPRSAYPHGHYDLLINVLSTVYSQSVKALLPS